MKYAIFVENTHSNFESIPLSGNTWDTEREARTELAMMFDNKTKARLEQAGLYFTIETVRPNTW